MEQKRCSSCGKIKPLDEFYNRTISKDGKSYICKQCQKKYFTEHKDKRNKWREEYYKKHPEKVRQYEKNRVCKILREHHDDVADDPEHLSTDFIASLIFDPEEA